MNCTAESWKGSYMTKVGDITGVTIDWSDGNRMLKCYMTTVGDVTGVTATLQTECWNGGGYVMTVGGGVTGMTRDLQGYRSYQLAVDFADAP